MLNIETTISKKGGTGTNNFPRNLDMANSSTQKRAAAEAVGDTKNHTGTTVYHQNGRNKQQYTLKHWGGEKTISNTSGRTVNRCEESEK